MDGLTYWVDIAVLLAGHRVVRWGADAVALDAKPARGGDHAAWGIGALIILFAAFFTFGLSLLLFVPYLIVWTVVAARRGRRSGLYLLTVDQDGRPATNPSGRVWTLLAAERKIQPLRSSGPR